MSNFENEFINRFKDQESLEGVDSAGIWNAVDAAMVADTTRGAAFYFTRGGLVLLAALMLLGGSCLYKNNASSNAKSFSPNNTEFKLALASNTTPSDARNTDSNFQLSAQQERSSNQNIAKANASTNNTQLFNQQQKSSGLTGADNNYQTTPRSDQSTQTDGKQNAPTGSATDFTKAKRTPTKMYSGTAIAEAADARPNDGKQTMQGTAATQKTTEPEDQKPGFFTENSKKLETNDLGGSPNPLPNQQMQYMTLISSQGIDNDQNRGMLACGGVVNYEKNIPLEAHFLLGINNTSIFYQENGADRLNETHFSDLGFSSKLGLTYINKRRTRFGIGFGYQEWNTKFEERTSTSTNFDLDDRIVGFTQDTSGTYTPVLGTLTYRGISNRHVLNHNKITMISIPVEIGKQFHIRRSRFGFNLGMTYNLLLNQSGRSLQYSEWIFDDESQYSIGGFEPFTKQVVTFHTNLFYDYAISDQLYLRLSPQVAYLGGQKRNTGINKFSMLNYGLDFGLVWDF